MAGAIEAATYAREIEYHRRNLQQAEKTLAKFAGTPERMEYGQALGWANTSKAEIARLTAGMSALSAPMVAQVKAKQTTLQIAADSGPKSTPSPLLYPEVKPMVSVPLPSGLRQVMMMGGGGGIVSSLASQGARAAAGIPSVTRSVAAQTTPQGVLGSVQSFIQKNPILTTTGVGIASGLLGYAVGRTSSGRAINPRTGKPYRRTNPTNFKALGRAIRRVNAFTKANNRVEKALRAAARSAR